MRPIVALFLAGFFSPFLAAQTNLPPDPGNAAPVLYGLGRQAGTPTTLYRIDPHNGDVSRVAVIGPATCHGLDTDHAGRLFATCREGPDLSLIAIDPVNGTTTNIGRLGNHVGSIEDISIRFDGSLYGFGLPSPTGLHPALFGTIYEIDRNTGEAVSAVSTNQIAVPGNGIAFDPHGVLYHSNISGTLNVIDPETGLVTPLLPLQFAIPVATDAPLAIVSKDFHPLNEALFGVVQSLGGESYLSTIDVNSGIVSVGTHLEVPLDAIAWSSAPPPQRFDHQLILPIVATGGLTGDLTHFQSNLTFLNLSSSTVTGTLEVFDSQGHERTHDVFCDDFPILPERRPVHIAPFGVEHLTTGPAQGSLLGWGRLAWSQQSGILAGTEVSLVGIPSAVCPGPICTIPSTRIRTTVQVRGVRPRRAFAGAVVISENRLSALTIVNPSPTRPAKVAVALLDENGEPFPLPGTDGIAEPAIVTGVLEPLHSVYLTVWDLFSRCDVRWQACPEVAPPDLLRPGKFRGSVHVRGSIPIALGGVHILLPEGRLVELPVAPLPRHDVTLPQFDVP